LRSLIATITGDIDKETDVTHLHGKKNHIY